MSDPVPVPRSDEAPFPASDGSRAAHIACIENGPYKVYGLERLIDERDGGDRDLALDPGGRTALCRCGRSERKPFCDGTHKRAGFTAPGIAPGSSGPPSGPEPTDRGVDPTGEDGVGCIVVRPGGPYRVSGRVSLRGAGADPPGTPFVLCRCGHSASKPLCDGSHRAIGFDNESDRQGGR